MLRLALRGSVLGQALLRAEGSYLAGMSTYLLKLGPELLGRAYARPIDRQIAGSLPGRCIRQRLGDMARLLADTLLPQLAASPGRSLDFINVAGGPAMDSINALLLLQRERVGLLAGRSVKVRVLDQDVSGAHFGQRALAALRGPSRSYGPWRTCTSMRRTSPSSVRSPPATSSRAASRAEAVRRSSPAG